MKIILSIFIFLFSNLIFSQDTLSLEQCLDFAVKNEMHYIQEKYELNKNLLNQRFDKLSVLPNLSANTGYYLNFGRKLDLFTNTFATNTVQANNFGLAATTYLFNGNRYFNQNKYNQLTIQKNNIDIKIKYELAKLSVIQQYVELLKLKYSIDNQNLVIDNLLKFKKRQVDLLNYGRLTKIDTLQTAIQIKNSYLAIRKLKQDYKLKLANLNFDCGFPSDKYYELKPLIEICSTCKVKIKELLELESLNLEEKSSTISNKISKSSFLPSLSLNGILGTGYSTNNKDFSQQNTPVKPYNDQINSNLYESVSLNLNIPIYNKGELIKNRKNSQLSGDFYTKQKELKQKELALKKSEIEQKKTATQEIISLTEEILDQKLAIYKLSESLYFEGKINIIELEKAFNDMEELKTNLINLRLDYLSFSVYE